MPIKGLSEIRRLPRLGKIHLGVKKKNPAGVEYPVAVDYFVCPPEVQDCFGEKPQALRVVFPPAAEEEFASQFYRAYSRTRGLVCKGDGLTADRTVEAGAAQEFKETGELPVPPIATHRDLKVERLDIPCPGRECPYFLDGNCKGVMNLQFMLPDVPGLGVYQIDTASMNSIVRINSALALIRGLFGRVAGIPVSLELLPAEVVADGKRKTVHVLDIRFPGLKLGEAMERIGRQKEATLVALPTGDVEVPDLLFPTTEEIEARDTERMQHDIDDALPPPPISTTPKPARAGLDPPQRRFSTVTEFWTATEKNGWTRDQVTGVLGVSIGAWLNAKSKEWGRFATWDDAYGALEGVLGIAE